LVLIIPAFPPRASSDTARKLIRRQLGENLAREQPATSKTSNVGDRAPICG
jgi:hypothetical protein